MQQCRGTYGRLSRQGERVAGAGAIRQGPSRIQERVADRPQGCADLVPSRFAEEQAQNLRTAAAIYQRVGEIDDKRIDARRKLGRRYLAGGAPNQVEPLLKEVMKTEPDYVDSLVLRAALAAHKNDIPSAQRDVGDALQKQPQNVDAAILTATLDMRTGHADEAVELLNKTIAQHPKNTGLHAVLAAIYAQQGKIDEGAAHIKSIIALEPQVASHRVRLAE